MQYLYSNNPHVGFMRPNCKLPAFSKSLTYINKKSWWDLAAILSVPASDILLLLLSNGCQLSLAIYPAYVYLSS